MNDQRKEVLVFRIAADGSPAQLVMVQIKPRPQNDGHADFFDRVHDFSAWMGDAFQQRQVTDFDITSLEEAASRSPAPLGSDDSPRILLHLLQPRPKFTDQ